MLSTQLEQQQMKSINQRPLHSSSNQRFHRTHCCCHWLPLHPRTRHSRRHRHHRLRRHTRGWVRSCQHLLHWSFPDSPSQLILQIPLQIGYRHRHHRHRLQRSCWRQRLEHWQRHRHHLRQKTHALHHTAQMCNLRLRHCRRRILTMDYPRQALDHTSLDTLYR